MTTPVVDIASCLGNSRQNFRRSKRKLPFARVYEIYDVFLDIGLVHDAIHLIGTESDVGRENVGSVVEVHKVLNAAHFAKDHRVRCP